MNFTLNAEKEMASQAWQNHVQSVKEHCLPSELRRLATHLDESASQNNFAYCMCNPGYFCKLECVRKEET